jgi:hypothetical protein
MKLEHLASVAPRGVKERAPVVVIALIGEKATPVPPSRAGNDERHRRIFVAIDHWKSATIAFVNVARPLGANESRTIP